MAKDTLQLNLDAPLGPTGPFGVDSATASGSTTIDVVFTEAVKQDDNTSTDDALHAPSYVITGGFRALRVKNVTSVSSTTVQLLVDEMTNGADYQVVVAGTISNDELTFTIADSGDDTATFIGLGILPGLASLSHVSLGTLEAVFDEAILQDVSSSAITSYTITPIGVAAPLHVTGISWSGNRSVATVKFIGGGSTYTLTVNGIMDDAGNYIDPNRNRANFEVLEFSDQSNIFMDTDLGAVMLEMRDMSERSIDDLIQHRAKQIGYETHLKRISKALQSAGISRDQSKIKFVKD